MKYVPQHSRIGTFLLFNKVIFEESKSNASENINPPIQTFNFNKLQSFYRCLSRNTFLYNFQKQVFRLLEILFGVSIIGKSYRHSTLTV